MICIDVMFLSHSKTEKLYSMTKKAIRSLIDNNPDYNFNICVIQTCDNKFGDKHYFNDDSIQVIHPNKKFHYNNFLRLGYNTMKHTSDYIMTCNDDIYFHKNSVSELMKGLQKYTICSPKNFDSKFDGNLQSKHKSGFIEGYNTSEHFSGFCHIVNKDIFKTIAVDVFWHKSFGGYFQDDWIAFLTKMNKIPICLCADSLVDHYERISWPNNYFSMRQKPIYELMKVWYHLYRFMRFFKVSA